MPKVAPGEICRGDASEQRLQDTSMWESDGVTDVINLS